MKSKAVCHLHLCSWELFQCHLPSFWGFTQTSGWALLSPPNSRMTWMGHFTFLIPSLFASNRSGISASWLAAGRLNEKVDGTATAILLAHHTAGSQTPCSLYSWTWQTSFYRLGYAMGGGDGWGGPGKEASVGHWPEKTWESFVD